MLSPERVNRKLELMLCMILTVYIRFIFYMCTYKWPGSLQMANDQSIEYLIPISEMLNSVRKFLKKTLLREIISQRHSAFKWKISWLSVFKYRTNKNGNARGYTALIKNQLIASLQLKEWNFEDALSKHLQCRLISKTHWRFDSTTSTIWSGWLQLLEYLRLGSN
jgi:hypothetical protein